MQERQYEPRDVRDVEEAAADQEEEQRADALERARRAASKIEKGGEGDCAYCGFHFTRVVMRAEGLACGRCRDENNLG